MKLAEAWRLSRIPYKEVVYRSLAEERGRMWWGAFGRNRLGKEAQDDLELTERALRIAKFDKTVVTFFNVIVSVAPFASLFLGAPAFGLTSSISLSLAVTFGFTTLYAIQTLSSFMSAESSALLSTMPLDRDDFSLITLFSFIRSFDYMVIGSILSQVILVAYLTGSPIATLIMFAASTMNMLFAITVALWFSRIFQKNLLLGGRSKTNTVLRLFFILMWGVLLIGVGFLFSIPWYIVPNLENTLLGAGHVWNLLLGLLYPFSTGIVITNAVYSNVTFMTGLLASAAMVGYGLLAILAGKWSLGTVRRVSQGYGVNIARVTARDFSVKPRGPLLGYVLKDLKVASRNPATAFFFALPVLETVIVTLLDSNFGTLRTALVLVGTSMGGIFTLFLPLALLSAEGRGLEYTKTLPISPRRIVIPKALVSTATYVPVPLALVSLSLVKPLTSPSTILIPLLIVMPVASASIFEIKLFLRTAAKGKIASVLNDFEKLTIGMFIILVPEVAYATMFLATFNHSLSLLAMGGVALAELAAALYILKRS
jgi:predicted permease